MSNNKQSSVEWLIRQLQKSKDWNRVLNEISQMSSAKIDIIEKAKAMHKDEACELAFKVGRGQDYDDEQVRELAEIYYNETYGGGEQ
jgi:hypothetical protein